MRVFYWLLWFVLVFVDLDYLGRIFGGNFAYALMDRSCLLKLIVLKIMASRMVIRFVTLILWFFFTVMYDLLKVLKYLSKVRHSNSLIHWFFDSFRRAQCSGQEKTEPPCMGSENWDMFSLVLVLVSFYSLKKVYSIIVEICLPCIFLAVVIWKIAHMHNVFVKENRYYDPDLS